MHCLYFEGIIIDQDVSTFNAPVDVAKLEFLVLATTCLRVDSLIILEGGSYSKNGQRVDSLNIILAGGSCSKNGLREDSLIILEGGSCSKNGPPHNLASIGWSWVVARATSKTDPSSASAGTASPSED